VKRSLAIGAILVGAVAAAGWYGLRGSAVDGPRGGSAPEAAEVDRSRCKDAAEAKDYVAADMINALKAKLERNDRTGGFADLTEEQRTIVAQAFRSGVGGPFFASRIVRSIALVEGLAERSSCINAQGSCQAGEFIRHLKTDAPGDPNKDKSWTELLAEWKGFRNGDIEAARICMTN
jgi:hypothetical protein